MMNMPEKKWFLLISLFLVVTTCAVYWQVVTFDYVDYDDPAYVSENPRVLQGLNPENIRWALTANVVANWHPVTLLSLLLDSTIFGPQPWGFHLTNLLLHLACSVLLFLLMVRCTKLIWASFIVAIAFALHPLHVESVAWISERKDVLSIFFWMLTMLFYCQYVQNKKNVSYLLALLFFAFGLMSKPMLVTLPCVLLLWDYWPLERMDVLSSQSLNPVQLESKKPLKFLVLEKTPFIILSAIICVVTIFAQKKTLMSFEAFSFKERLFNALVSYVNYIAKMFYPTNLAVFYPHPQDTLQLYKVIISVIILFSVSLTAVLLGRRRKYFLIGWLWYLGTLVPVIGLVQVSEQAMADRYTYIPYTGLFIILAWGIYDFFKTRKNVKRTLIVIALLISAILMVCSFRQASYWKNTYTLFTHALEVTSEKDLVYNQLGVYFAANNKTEKAFEYFNSSLKIRPNDKYAHYNLGKLFFEQGKTDQAIEKFEQVLRLKSDDINDVKTYNLLAQAFLQQNKISQAIAVCQHGLDSHPDAYKLHNLLGILFSQIDRIEDAIVEFHEALKIMTVSDIYSNLGAMLASQGKFDQAIDVYNKAILLEPNNVKAYYNLARILMQKGNVTQAIVEFRRVIELDPRHVGANKALQDILQE